MEKNYKLFKMINGEMVLTEVTDVTDEGEYILSYPSVVIPVPPQQAGGQQNQIGFGKYLPFSDYSKEIALNPDCVAVDTTPSEQMLNTYLQWCTQMRAQESGIVMAGSMPKGPVVRDGKADFSKLNM